MPLSNDNQDYGEKDRKNKTSENKDKGNKSDPKNAQADEGNFSSDNLKGKKVDRDPGKETDEPADI
jgi:hypothetical protein